MKIGLHDFARILVNAANVDIDIWARNTLFSLRNTSQGQDLVSWAEANPQMFRNLLRTASAGLGELPRSESLLKQSVLRALQHLPAELHHVIEQGDGDMQPDDPEFRNRYEESLDGLTDEQLSQVSRLSKQQLREWVNSPKAIRPHLLIKWQEPSAVEQKVNSVYNEFSNYIERESEAIRQREAQMSPLRRWFRKLIS